MIEDDLYLSQHMGMGPTYGNNNSEADFVPVRPPQVPTRQRVLLSATHLQMASASAGSQIDPPPPYSHVVISSSATQISTEPPLTPPPPYSPHGSTAQVEVEGQGPGENPLSVPTRVHPPGPPSTFPIRLPLYNEIHLPSNNYINYNSSQPPPGVAVGQQHGFGFTVVNVQTNVTASSNSSEAGGRSSGFKTKLKAQAPRLWFGAGSLLLVLLFVMVFLYLA